MSQPRPVEVEGDETEIECPCGDKHSFESADGEPNEGMQPIECDCGRKLKVIAVSWSAWVTAEVEGP